jgi:hypothetical protein
METERDGQARPADRRQLVEEVYDGSVERLQKSQPAPGGLRRQLVSAGETVA